MAQFEEVLDGVRLALTLGSPAEIQALLEGLVKERIISVAYSKNLNRFTKGFAPVPSETARKPASDPINYPGLISQQHVNPGEHSQVCQDGALSYHTQTRLEYASPVREYCCMRTRLKTYPSVMDEPNLNPRLSSTQITHEDCCSLGLNDKMTMMRKVESECKRRNEGNLENEKEWLEQVEEAARRIAVPLWQHWDRGWRMLMPLVPTATTGCSTSENTATGSEAQCPGLIMGEETELAIACRTLDLYNDNFNYTEITDQGFTLDSSHCQVSVATNALDVDHLGFSGAVWNTSGIPHVEARGTDTNSITDMRESDPNICWVARGTSSGTEDLLCATLGVPDSTVNIGTTDGLTGELRLDSHWDAKMQKVDHDPFICPSLGDLPGLKTQEVDHDLCISPEFGDLPDDLSEYLNEDYLSMIVDTDVLFGDPLLSCVDDLNNYCDTPLPFELPSPDSHPQRQEEKLSDKKKNRRRRPRVPQSQQSTDESTPSRPKRQRVAGQPKRKLAQAEPPVKGTDTESEPSPANMADLATTPPRILQLHPSIQFITIPDTPGYQVVQTLRLSPPVIRLPIPNTAAAPTYILVPAASPPCKRQVLPLSPLDGAVVPVQMSSSPPGSLSDTASKAMSPTCASPLSPSDPSPTCKESPLPQSARILDIPPIVKDYIQEAKTHMSQTSLDMGEGLRLTSHYVDVQLSQREIFSRCGKNTNKFLGKELIIMGDTDWQKSLMGQSQIFEGPNGDKPKRYIMLLGNAGMGKTTLIKKLCLEWSRDCIPQFDFVFLLDGKELTLTEPTFSLQTLLLNQSSFVPTCFDPDTVYAQIIAVPKRVLIIFDGFDELRDYESLLQTQEKDLITSLQRDSKAQTYTIRQLYSAILQRVLLPGCTLLLSARPRGTVNQLLRRTDSFLEVCGFSSTDIETYVSQYFTDPTLTASALNYLKSCSYLHLLCWKPGLCRLVCMVLEQSKSLKALPRTLTGLCHQVLHLKMKKDSSATPWPTEPQTEISVQSVKPQTDNSSDSQVKRCHQNPRTKFRSQLRTQRSRRTKKQQTEEDEVDGEEIKCMNGEVDRTEERVLLSQLSSMAWDGVKANSSVLPAGPTIPAKLKAFGLRTGLLFSYDLRTRHALSSGDMTGKGGEDGEEKGKGENENILFWASPFLQSYLAAVHLSLSRTVSDRTFLQALPSMSGQRGRRRPQREELELTQRFAFGLLFHNRTELQRLHSCTEAAFRDMLVSKQALVTKHLEGFLNGDLSPAQVLEACHYVYEASLTHGDSSRDGDRRQLIAQLAAKLPEVLTFHGVPLNPADVFAVQNVLKSVGSEGQNFCLDLVDSGIKISGLRTLVGLSNINTYRACIADVITLWEQLERSGEESLRQKAVSKFKIHPLKATQVCHIEHLAKLVNMHMQKRLSDSSSQPDSILAGGVPAVKELHKLEFELGPENGPRALPKLWELLPGLHCLQHLDLENSKIGDEGAEKLADALVSLSFLEVLNLSQNCIGDQGMRQLATTLRELPKLHCLSLYSNVISDEGAKSLAAVLPHMTSLTDLDVKYNKLTDVGAQSLGVSLRNCKKMKTLRMWNQCIPYGVFERLQQQDNRILWH